MTRRSTSLATCVTAALLSAAAEAPLLACPVCFRVEESAVTDGLRAAVLVLVAVTVAVLSGFAAFIVRWRGTEPFSTDLAQMGTEVGRASDQTTSVPISARSVEKGSVPL